MLLIPGDMPPHIRALHKQPHNKKKEAVMKKCLTVKLALLCFSVVFILALISTASGQPGEWVNGVLQPLEDGFPDRAITIVNPSS